MRKRIAVSWWGWGRMHLVGSGWDWGGMSGSRKVFLFGEGRGIGSNTALQSRFEMPDGLSSVAYIILFCVGSLALPDKSDVVQRAIDGILPLLLYHPIFSNRRLHKNVSQGSVRLQTSTLPHGLRSARSSRIFPAWGMLELERAWSTARTVGCRESNYINKANLKYNESSLYHQTTPHTNPVCASSEKTIVNRVSAIGLHGRSRAD